MEISKTLSRIIKASFDVDSHVEHISFLNSHFVGLNETQNREGGAKFVEKYIQFLKKIDQVIHDQEKTISLRDRTLQISSEELTNLNDEIVQKTKKEKEIIENLIQTLSKIKQSSLNQKSKIELEKFIDLSSIVNKVDSLIEYQVRTSEKLEAIFKESLNLSSCQTFNCLKVQLEKSIVNLFGNKLGIKFYFSGSFFEEMDQLDYFLVDHQSEAISLEALSKTQSQNEDLFLNLKSTKGKGDIAVLILNVISAVSLEEREEIIQNMNILIPILSSTIENISLHKEEKYKVYLESELYTAKLVQQTLLPNRNSNFPLNRIEISGFYQNANECGGDWWTYFVTKQGKCITLVGDVTGHGTASAMVCAVVKGYADSFLVKDNIKLSEIISELNLVVCHIGKSIQRLMTMVAISIDEQTGELRYVNAGHPHPLVIRNNNDKMQLKYLISSGTPLGLNESSTYEEKTFKVLPGDKILLSSDGLLDVETFGGVSFSEYMSRSLLPLIYKEQKANLWNKSIFKELQKFVNFTKLEDDVTSVVVGYN